jgi:SAM-dependent methyltransferase
MNPPPHREGTAGRCGVCGATGARELYTAGDALCNTDQEFAIASCDGCGVLRTLPEMTAEELASFYRNDYWGELTSPSRDWILRSQAEKLSFLSRCGLAGGRILDVGCGAGFFLRALDGRLWERFGVEIGPEAARLAARELGEDRVREGSLTGAQFADASFDVVAFWSSLEHTTDPRAQLMSARRIVKPRGTVIVQVPNAGSYQARVFKSDWYALDAPRHRYHFTRGTLDRLIRECGFEPYRMTQFSRAHNAHALKHSLKRRIWTGRPTIYRGLFYLTAWMIRPIDLLLTAVDEGATLTVAARAM